jgi:hypothetical protein
MSPNILGILCTALRPRRSHLQTLEEQFRYRFYSIIFYVVIDSSHYRVNNYQILSGGGLYTYYVVEDIWLDSSC